MKDTNRIYHVIVREILELIDSGLFPVGSRLPSERELARRFGVNRTYVREAKIVLETQGRLKVKPGSGSYVVNYDDIASNEISNLACLELVEAQALFEAEVAALAAPLITDETIQELERLAAIIAGKVKCEITPNEAIATFYKHIARATNNRAIIFVIESMWDIEADDNQAHLIHQRVYSQLSAYLEDEYQAIISALKKRDPAQARKATQDHFSRIMKSLLKASELDAYQEMKRKTSQNRSRYLLSSQLS